MMADEGCKMDGKKHARKGGGGEGGGLRGVEVVGGIDPSGKPPTVRCGGGAGRPSARTNGSEATDVDERGVEARWRERGQWAEVTGDCMRVTASNNREPAQQHPRTLILCAMLGNGIRDFHSVGGEPSIIGRLGQADSSIILVPFPPAGSVEVAADRQLRIYVCIGVGASRERKPARAGKEKHIVRTNARVSELEYTGR